MPRTLRQAIKAIIASGALLPAMSIGASLTTQAGVFRTSTGPTFRSQVFATGAHLTHHTANGKEALSDPDDITTLGAGIFVAFQNGVGPQGQASPSGSLDSTIVEFDHKGKAIAQWDVKGKCDGVTADPLTGRLIATVNEDANSSVYLINPTAARPVHYHYNEPLPSDGGTDAITVYGGTVLISASAPGTTGPAAPQPNYPAAYRVDFHSATRTAVVHALFFDKSPARVANTNSTEAGKTVSLALTDPDSNETVPAFASRFAGDFMLTSQGDKEQIFVRHAGEKDQSLSVLTLANSVDDTAWASSSGGAIYTTDNSNDTIYKITGPFVRGEVFAAVTPCDADDAPATCPAPGFPKNYVARLNQRTGALTKVRLIGPAPAVQGMLFLR